MISSGMLSTAEMKPKYGPQLCGTTAIRLSAIALTMPVWSSTPVGAGRQDQGDQHHDRPAVRLEALLLFLDVGQVDGHGDGEARP